MSLNLQVRLQFFFFFNSQHVVVNGAVPTGGMVGTSGQWGHEHKGLGGQACRAAGAAVQKQTYLSCFSTAGAPSKKTTALR